MASLSVTCLAYTMWMLSHEQTGKIVAHFLIFWFVKLGLATHEELDTTQLEFSNSHRKSNK